MAIGGHPTGEAVGLASRATARSKDLGPGNRKRHVGALMLGRN